MTTYLEFESSIEALENQLKESSNLQESGVKTDTIKKEIQKELENVIKQTYKNLSPWQKVLVSRHPERPYTLSYIDAITDGNFIELHGDRNFADDKAMIGAFGKIDNQSVMFIGQQKGINTKMRQYRNFGMANPEGYRKALRLMKLAEKFNKPIVCLIDTPGAFPGIEAEERGQGEAIAKNLYEMFRIKVPILVFIIGEGASGGALGIGVGDRVFMLEHAWYSVISPENCSTILFRSRDFKEDAAKSLSLTGKDMLKNKLIDGIVKEPLGGAHRNPEQAFKNVKKEIQKALPSLLRLSKDKLISNRIEKFCNMGVFNDK